jgi:hypothetical protein
LELLGAHEYNAARDERAFKHFIIAAKLGCDGALDKVKEGFAEGYVSKEDYAAALRGHQAAVWFAPATTAKTLIAIRTCHGCIIIFRAIMTEEAAGIARAKMRFTAEATAVITYLFLWDAAATHPTATTISNTLQHAICTIHPLTI